MKPIVAPNLYLFSTGHGDEPKFIRSFRQAWRAIPLSDKKLMLEHWRSEKHRMGIAFVHPRKLGKGSFDAKDFLSPRIELLSGWNGRYATTSDEHVGHLAMTSCSGHWLRFWATLFDRMPDHVAQGVIVHELAHVLQYANGYLKHFGRDDPPDGVVEEDADLIMEEEWGVDPFAVDEWAAGQGFGRTCNTFEEWIESYCGPAGRYGGD